MGHSQTTMRDFLFYIGGASVFFLADFLGLKKYHEGTSTALGPLAGAKFREKSPRCRFDSKVFSILFDKVFELEPWPCFVSIPLAHHAVAVGEPSVRAFVLLFPSKADRKILFWIRKAQTRLS